MVSSILAMGALGILLSIFIGEQYRQFSVDSQRSAFSEIIRLQVNESLEELQRYSKDLGGAIQSTSTFRALYKSANKQEIAKHLESQFHQYFVTAGVIKLKRLTVFNENVLYLTHVMNEEHEFADYGDQQCGNLVAAARKRAGTDRLKIISGLCMVNGEPNFGVLVPVGGLRVIGYIEVLTDPSYNFTVIENKIGMPLKMQTADGTETYRSIAWPAGDEVTGILAEYMIKTNVGDDMLQVSIVHDDKGFRDNYQKTRNTVLLFALIAVLLLASLMFFILNRSALEPLKSLGERLRKVKQDGVALGLQLDVKGNKEIRELSQGFNEMTRNLKNVYDELRHANSELKTEIGERIRVEEELKAHRGKLEELVDKRTADLVLARDEALQANRAKSKFLANMSHELRTPLNAIIGYSEILIEDVKGSSDSTLVHDDLDKIKSSGKHLLSLINGILDLSKVEAGKMDLYVEEFSMDLVISDLVATMQPLVMENNNNLDVNNNDSGVLYTDLTKLRQALYNLLSNANKFTRNGKITLDIDRKSLGGGEFVIISIKDNGIGISKDRMPDLFQAFSQADLSTTKEYGGTGLGLIISRHFCNMMGGDINVESEEGKGSIFKIILPADVTRKTTIGLLSIADEEKGLPPVDPELIRFTASSATEKKYLERRSYVSKVLVIDDDHVAVDLMARFLAREGYRSEVATSGKEGLIKAREFKPDVITLDIMMPGMDGWTVLDELGKDPETKDIPVIVLTMMEDRSRGFTLGAKGYLTKPFDRNELSEILKNCVQGPGDRSVLIVDDDADVRNAANYVMEKNGWATSEAENGVAALECLKQKTPDLILLDLVMPEMDGFEFIVNLKKNPDWANIPVVVMTAKEMSSEEEKELGESVRYIFNKGMYNFHELFDEVSVLLRKMVRKKQPVMKKSL